MLLPGMMRLGRFWFGRFFSWRYLTLEPFGVKDARLVDALVGMRAKEIALRLEQIRGKASRAITIEIANEAVKAGTATPCLTAVETTIRQLCCVLLMALVKY